ncbi:DUF3108 domain-containing protein [Ancylomarina euxinus]|uniref:DUF3108 domain-containing protein n=1 Tax=Ancylomarina euxinus TaxID=2283627 RepID=A0A425XZX1_9BACT|nr:DUF3108 domain-containing protein [Ancylomarina euxinus]RRG20726.1 DUF3108 domain-containing protein [Ancylomarina euxinus]
MFNISDLRYILFILVLICSIGQLKSQEKSGIENFAFQSGEKLTFRGYYNWGFLWVAAGEVKLEVKNELYSDKPAYKIEALGRSLKAFDWFFKLRDTISCYVDTTSLKPFYFDRKTHEGDYIARHEYWFDYDKDQIYSKIRKRQKPEKKDTLENKTISSDIVSVAYYTRNLDFSKYKKKEKIPLRMLIDNEVHNLYIRYKGIENVKLKSGEVYECLKFSPMLVKGHLFQGGEDMTIWVSNDRNRVPIMVEAKVLIGSVKGLLNSYEGLRSTRNSHFKKRSGKVELD